MQLTLQQLTKENEEYRAYIDVLKSSLDSRAAQLGLGSKKVFNYFLFNNISTNVNNFK